MLLSKKAALALAMISFGALAACGGRFDAGNDDAGGGGTDGGSGSDGGGHADSGGSDGGGGKGCPSTPPFGASTCPRIGLQCEYGDDPSPSCNAFFECTASGWANHSGNGGCDGPAKNCPATYASVPKGAECTQQGAQCTYPQGECFCTLGAGGPPPPPGEPARWLCRDAVAGCPEPRPRLGTECSSPGKECDYGGCLGGAVIECIDGAWHDSIFACPAAAR
jgi:hypothetical protein